jgi:hypothetical protein
MRNFVRHPRYARPTLVRLRQPVHPRYLRRRSDPLIGWRTPSRRRFPLRPRWRHGGRCYGRSRNCQQRAAHVPAHNPARKIRNEGDNNRVENAGNGQDEIGFVTVRFRYVALFSTVLTSFK